MAKQIPVYWPPVQSRGLSGPPIGVLQMTAADGLNIALVLKPDEDFRGHVETLREIIDLYDQRKL